MRARIERFDWKLTVGIVLVTLLALGAVVCMWQWSEHKDTYYLGQMEKCLSRRDFVRAAEYAKLAEETGAVGKINEVSYQQACALLEQGAYSEAQEKFSALGVYEDAAALAAQCIVLQAEQLENDGQFQQAAELYQQAGQSEAALQGYQRCRYALALEAEQEQRLQEAFHLYWEVRVYADAYDRALKIAFAITGSNDEEEALRLARGFSQEEWLHIEELKASRERIAMHRLAAGWDHCLLLQADGTVKAYGDNAFGQTEVSDWQNVSAVAAGAYHSLALRSDGTVIAVGNNEHGQCDVSEWNNVVAVCCGPWDSFGLTDQGTVLHCGYADDSAPTALRQVKQIEAGNAAWAALLEDGSLACSVASGENDAWQDCTDVAVGLGWTAVLFENGTADCTDYDLSAWTDVLELTAGSTLLVGIRADGTLVTQPLMPAGTAVADALNGLGSVKGIALSSHWALVLHWDDTAELVGAADFSVE